MLARYSELQDRFRLVGRLQHGPAHRDRAARPRLRVRTTRERPCETFSGGWQMRIALAKLLLGRPNLLLLDEPTNHLDLEARNWLEEYLGAYPYAVILVSHDRYFLDAVVTRITDLNLRKLTDYVGNYSKYVEQRDAMLERLRQAKREQDEEVARVKMFIDRFRYQATKAAQVQSRIKLLEKVVPIEVPPERKRIHFTFPGVREERPHGARAEARAQGATAALDRVQGCAPAHRARRPHRAGRAQRRRQVDADADAVGRRGAGRGHADARPPGRDGVLRAGRSDPARSRRSPSTRRCQAGSPNDMVPAIRNILGGFLFSGDDVYKKAGVLSGGERTRLAVARMLLRPSNTLLLDEPTNHLDLDSKDVLLDALEDYGGTLIIVSHDRYFVEKLATKIIEIGHGEALVYPGTYAEFLWRKEQPDGRSTPNVPRAQAPKARPTPKAQSRQPRRPRQPKARQKRPGPTDRPRSAEAAEAERKKKQRAAESLQKRIADLEARIAEREAQVKELEAAMSAPGFYDDRDASKHAHRPAPGADVGGRRPDGAVGSPPGARGSES